MLDQTAETATQRNAAVAQEPRKDWPSGPTVWVGWFVATLLGWLTGLLAMYGLMAALDNRTFSYVIWGTISSLAEGLAIGFLLWVLVMRRFPHGRAWIIATTIGWAAGMLAIDVTNHVWRWCLGDYAEPLWRAPERPELWLVCVPLGATILGLSQWVILRRWLPNALEWVGWTLFGGLVASVVFVWVLSPYLGLPLRDVLQGPPAGSSAEQAWGVAMYILFWYLASLAGVTAFAAVTGLAATRIVSQRRGYVSTE